MGSLYWLILCSFSLVDMKALIYNYYKFFFYYNKNIPEIRQCTNFSLFIASLVQLYFYTLK